MQGQLHSRVADVVFELCHRCKVHEISSIDGDISAKLLVSAEITSALFTAILDVINHEASIVY